MAFLVCYSTNPPADHTERKAIYLSQRFYELIFAQCLDTVEYDILSHIANLKYKSPVYIVTVADLPKLASELVTLLKIDSSVPEIEEFKAVCEVAVSQAVALTVSGDMYPELNNGLA